MMFRGARSMPRVFPGKSCLSRASAASTRKACASRRASETAGRLFERVFEALFVLLANEALLADVQHRQAAALRFSERLGVGLQPRFGRRILHARPVASEVE